MNLRNLFQLAAIPAAAALMTACGGGGGGGGNGGGGTPGSGTIDGSSTKGIIKNGIVTLSQPGVTGGATGSGRTTADGRYSLSYSGYTSGLVQLCVTGDAKTTVVCDSSDGDTDCGPSNDAAGDTDDDGTFDFGEELPAPANFRMCTLLSAPPTNGVSAPITPFTNVVVQRALERDADAALNENLSTALANAASEINQLLGGLDVLRLDPVDLSDDDAVAAASPEALVYAALIAAVLGNSVNDLAPDAPLDLNAVVQTILDSTEGGEIGLDEFRDLVGEAQRQLLDLGESDDTGVLAMLQDQATEAEDNGQPTFDPEPATDANTSGITRARALIQNVRNTYSSLDQYRQPLDAFGVDLDASAGVVEANEATAEVLSAVLTSAREFFVNDPSCTDEVCSTTSNGITTAFTVSGGTLTGTMTGTTPAPKPATVDIQITAPAGRADGLTSAALNVVRATVSTSTARLRVTEGNATINLNAPFDADAAQDEVADNNQSPQIIDSASFDLVGSVEALSGGAVLASATGTIRFDAVRATQCMLAPSSPDDDGDASNNLDGNANVANLTLIGAVATSTESADLSLSYNLVNARSFCPLTDIGPTNKPDADLTVTANLNLDAVPDARAVFTASLDDVFTRVADDDDDRTQGFIANASVNLLQGNVQVFRLQAASSRPTGANNERITATVTDRNNAMMVLTADVNAAQPVEGQIGVLTVDGVQVGIIRQLESGLVIARYDDGSFESLF